MKFNKIDSYGSGSKGLFIVGRNIVSTAVSHDDITISHTINFCKPVPNDNFRCNIGIYPEWTDCGIYTRDLKNFPLDDLPSGGPCDPTKGMRISPSEMFIMFLQLNNYPLVGIVTTTWLNKDTGIIIYQHSNNMTTPNPDWTYWYWWVWSLVGRFTWEINKTGNYQCILTTPFGTASIDFTIIDTSITCPSNLSVVLGIPS